MQSFRNVWPLYQKLAHLYDWPGALDFSDLILQKTQALLQQHAITPPGPIADIACGTGGISIALAQQGWDVMALDLSPAMLQQAQAKAEGEALKIQWLQGDMQHFQLPHLAQAALCYCDSLNHLLTPEALGAAFQAIAQNLEPGGLFCFDLNTWENYQALWNGKDRTEGPNYRLAFTAHFDESTGRALTDITADEYTETGFRQQQEAVIQQYFSQDLVLKQLQQSGFEDIQVEPFNPLDLLPEGQSLKTFWTCHKGVRIFP